MAGAGGRAPTRRGWSEVGLGAKDSLFGPAAATISAGFWKETSVTALPKGTELDGFTVDRVLGQGGFGITYLADDPTLDRHVAIKEYFPQMWALRDGATVSANSASTGDYNWGLQSFVNEAKTLARFRHPSIVHVNRTIEANGTAYMVLDYEEGDDFGKWLERLGRPPTQEELDGIAERLLDALSIVHRNRILHRDIAPDNIKIRKTGTPVLLDFGAAREAMGHRTGTMTGIVKHGYSPVEQYSRTGKDQGPWTDIYALGATLYKAVTGAAPPEAIDRLREDEFVPAARSARGMFRPGFLAAIDHALARDPADRPQTVTDWESELLAGGTTRRNETVPASRRADEKGAAGGNEQRRRRGGGWKWIAALLLIGLLGAGGYYYAGVIRPDEQDWTRARSLDTVAAYQTYLTEQPQGRHAAEANARIAALREAAAAAEQRQAEERRGQEQAAREQRDRDAWANADRQNTLEAYRAYLTAQPQGRFAAEANARIKALEEAERLRRANAEAEARRKEAEERRRREQAAALERRDSEAWGRAQRVDSVGAYQAYLRDFPSGQHADDARRRIGALTQEELGRKTEAEAKTSRFKPGQEIEDCANCPKLVVLPAGQVTIGSPAAEPARDKDEGPQHSVTIAKPFAVGKFEVTFEEWDACVADGGCNGHRPADQNGRGKKPVTNVSWNDAKAYVDWLSRKTGKRYRLLSEREWEYAARAGTTTRYSFGDRESELCDYANSADSSTTYDWRNQSCSDGVAATTAEVGRYKVNPFGLHDMHGNVWEWVEDCWNDSYQNAPTDGSAWTTGKCDDRVLRGGSWLSPAADLRAAKRGSYKLDTRLPAIGFRVARELDG